MRLETGDTGPVKLEETSLVEDNVLLEDNEVREFDSVGEDELIASEREVGGSFWVVEADPGVVRRGVETEIVVLEKVN